MKQNTGFTLIEISIVLVVVGLLLTGILSGVQAQLEASKLRETRQLLTETRDALVAHAFSNRRLPCPADPALANTAATAGLEDLNPATGLCRRVNGVVPWNTLGLKEVDAWGGRLSYSVSDATAAAGGGTNNFARRSINSTLCPGQNPLNTFGLCSIGGILVFTAPGASNLTAAAVIVSHGKNRRGSFNSNGGARIAGALGDELENANGITTTGQPLDTIFINHPFVHDPNPYAATYYDDIVEWVPGSLLIGKMVGAGLLP